MVAHRTLTPFVRVRILLPLPEPPRFSEAVFLYVLGEKRPISTVLSTKMIDLENFALPAFRCHFCFRKAFFTLEREKVMLNLMLNF